MRKFQAQCPEMCSSATVKLNHLLTTPATLHVGNLVLLLRSIYIYINKY